MEALFCPDDDLQHLSDEAYKFAKNNLLPLVGKHEKEHRISRRAWELLAEFGALGLPYPEEYGGAGVSPFGCALVGEAFGRAGIDGGLALSWGAHTFLTGCTILEFGTDEQKAKYLPKMATAEWLGAFGLTEPNAGSDVSGMKATYRRVDGGFILNGQKTYVTNAPDADFFIIFATRNPEEKQAGISAFLVDFPARGLVRSDLGTKVCTRASATGEVFLEDVFVPEENLFGMEGAGFLIAMAGVEWDRSQLLAPYIGSLEYVLELAVKYAQQRHQFGRPIASFHAVKALLARTATLVHLAKPLVRRICYLKGEGGLHHVEGSVAKLFVGNYGLEAASNALQVFGGAGLFEELGVERIFRDARLGSVGGGTSEIQKRILSRCIGEDPSLLAVGEEEAPSALEGREDFQKTYEKLWAAKQILADLWGVAGRVPGENGKPMVRSEALSAKLAEAFCHIEAAQMGITGAYRTKTGEYVVLSLLEAAYMTRMSLVLARNIIHEMEAAWPRNEDGSRAEQKTLHHFHHVAKIADDLLADAPTFEMLDTEISQILLR